MITRIAVMSDIHIDFWASPSQRAVLVDGLQRKCRDLNADVVVFAGDASNGHVSLITGREENVISVPGNHDYYGHSLPTEPDIWFDENFAATTLWTNFAGSNGQDYAIFQQIADSTCIEGSTAVKVKELCEASFNKLVELNREIVVTHFPPSRKSVAEKYHGNFVNPYFTNDFDNRIAYEMTNTKLWICGHTHHKHHYYIGDCLVVANPLGYPSEQHTAFTDYEPVLVVKEDGMWKIQEK